MTIPTLLFALTTVLAPQGKDATVSLGRVFVKNQKLAYEVRSSLHAEHRARGVETWIPEDIDLNYDFTTVVDAMKPDGIAVLHYQRPIMHQIEGETFTSPPKDTAENVNLNFHLTVSPINEILEAKDLNEKSGKPQKKADDDSMMIGHSAVQQNLAGLITQFAGEMFRLSLFAGSFDSALDFAPKTPIEDVKVGESWKRTVGYQPQKLKGKGEKQAVQRLDYTFTYKGIVESEGKKVYRVEGKLDLKTDIGDFINQLAGMKPEDTGLKKVPLTMKSTIEFDLDLQTKHTLLAQAKTESGFSIFVTDFPDDAVEEEKINGHTTMRLVGQRILPNVKKAGK